MGKIYVITSNDLFLSKLRLTKKKNNISSFSLGTIHEAVFFDRDLTVEDPFNYTKRLLQFLKEVDVDNEFNFEIKEINFVKPF